LINKEERKSEDEQFINNNQYVFVFP